MYIIIKNYATEDDSVREDDVYCCNIMPMKIWRNTSVREKLITHWTNCTIKWVYKLKYDILIGKKKRNYNIIYKWNIYPSINSSN